MMKDRTCIQLKGNITGFQIFERKIALLSEAQVGHGHTNVMLGYDMALHKNVPFQTHDVFLICHSRRSMFSLSPLLKKT
jgi:hypothetical protein